MQTAIGVALEPDSETNLGVEEGGGGGEIRWEIRGIGDCCVCVWFVSVRNVSLGVRAFSNVL